MLSKEKKEKIGSNLVSRDEPITEDFPLYRYENGCFVKRRDGSTFDLLQINCKDLMAASEDENEYDALCFEKLYRKYSGDLKIIGINFPTNTKANKEYTAHKIEITRNSVYKKMLLENYNLLDWLERNRTDREYYLMFFSASVQEHDANLNSIYYILSDNGLASIMSEEKKKQVLFKINNKCTSIYNVDNEIGAYESKKSLDKDGRDLRLLHDVQPQGGVSFKDEKLIKTGDGYEVCLHVYGYPKRIDSFWLTTLVNLNNIVVTIDIGTKNTNDVIQNINKGMDEQSSRARNGTDEINRRIATRKYYQLEELFNEVDGLGEIVKLITVRIFVAGKTKAETEDILAKLFDYLDNHSYRSAVFLNENENEWASMYRSYTEQMESRFKRSGQPVTSGTLAAGDPFHFSTLKDPLGFPWGTTSIDGGGGAVTFDLFARTATRQSYDMAIVGKKGSGKSTAIKKLLKDRAIRGDYIRGFDVADEYRTEVEKMGGKIIALDGSEGILNALEIYKTAETEQISYARHLSKMTTVYKFIDPDASSYDVMEFESLCRDLYEVWKLTPTGGRQVTGLDPEAYPIFSDLLKFINEKEDEIRKGEKSVSDESRERLLRLDRIRLGISSLVHNYGYIFDGHSTIRSMLDTQIVFYNIKNLVAMRSEIFDVQIFLAFSLCWDNCVQIGTPMKKLYDTHKIRWEDITRFILFIDEAHHMINVNKLKAVEQIIVYLREARKFFGGLVFATQSIRDYVPEGSDSTSINAIKTLFELTQYKMIMTQDSNTLKMMQQIFRNQLTDTEIKRIPKLGTGQCILSISGGTNIEFNISISKEEKDMFQGGA